MNEDGLKSVLASISQQTEKSTKVTVSMHYLILNIVILYRVLKCDVTKTIFRIFEFCLHNIKKQPKILPYMQNQLNLSKIG